MPHLKILALSMRLGRSRIDNIWRVAAGARLQSVGFPLNFILAAYEDLSGPNSAEACKTFDDGVQSIFPHL
jgi:hypothetical protein